jgi:hypothetical protein
MELKKEPNSGILEAKVGLDGILDALGFREAKKGCFGGGFLGGYSRTYIVIF